MRRVAVIGGGAAGVAAAWAARRAGAAVTLFWDRPGATELCGGCGEWSVRDVPRGGEPGNQRGAPDRVTPEVLELLRELGLWRWQPDTAWLATVAGVVRPSGAVEPSLLDLAPCAGQRVAVADVERDDWDAALLARALQVSPWAEATQTRFQVLPLRIVQHPAERRVALRDFAALCDHPARLARLGEELRAHARGVNAVLLGPWLGTRPGVRAALQADSGVVAGEALCTLEGPSGARFDLARAALLARCGIDGVEGAVEALRGKGAQVQVTWSGGALCADQVVLATGSLVGGGARYEEPWGSPRLVGALALDGRAPSFGVGAEELALAAARFDPTTGNGAWLQRVAARELPARISWAGAAHRGDGLSVLAALGDGVEAGERAARG